MPARSATRRRPARWDQVRALAPGAAPEDRDWALVRALRDAMPARADVVGVLLDAGADPRGALSFNAEGRRTRTYLELAASTGKTEIVALLVAKGADVKGDAGGFALRRAVESGNAEVLAALLHAGAPATFQHQGEDAAAFARRVGQPEMARVLGERGRNTR